MEFSSSILKSDGVFGVRMVEWRGDLTIQGQMVEIPFQSPGKLSIFPVLSLFFYLSLPKIWHAYPIKILFPKLTRIDLSSHIVLKLKILDSGSI